MAQRNGRGRDDSTDQDQDGEGEGSYEGAVLDGGGGTAMSDGFQNMGYGAGTLPSMTGASGMGASTYQHPNPTNLGPFDGGNGNAYSMPTIPIPMNGIMPSKQEIWNPNHPPTWGIQPSANIPVDQSLAVSAITNVNANTNTNVSTTTTTEAGDGDAAFEDVWRILFGDNTGFTPTPTPVHTAPPAQFAEPDPTIDLPLLSVFTPSVYGAADSRHAEYLHHYLNVVLPRQYRFGKRQLMDLIGPLAMTRKEVLTSAASLAALHMVAQKTQKPMSLPTSWTAADEAIDEGTHDNDTLIATSAHRRSIERLRFISSEDLTSEDVIVSALFAISFHLFSGGTSREWREVMNTSQRCLSAALSASPELSGTSYVFLHQWN